MYNTQFNTALREEFYHGQQVISKKTKTSVPFLTIFLVISKEVRVGLGYTFWFQRLTDTVSPSHAICKKILIYSDTIWFIIHLTAETLCLHNVQ